MLLKLIDNARMYISNFHQKTKILYSKIKPNSALMKPFALKSLVYKTKKKISLKNPHTLYLNMKIFLMKKFLIFSSL